MTVSPVTYPSMPAMMPSVPNMMMVPRCTVRMEKCTTGVKIHCVCTEAVAVSMVQNLCSMQASQMVGCYVTMNGQTVCSVNFCCCVCTVEKTVDGVCIHCTTGDATCCQVVQCWYDEEMNRAELEAHHREQRDASGDTRHRSAERAGPSLGRADLRCELRSAKIAPGIKRGYVRSPHVGEQKQDRDQPKPRIVAQHDDGKQ